MTAKQQPQVKSILFIFAFLFMAGTALADSPLTSTSLHIGYEDQPLVKSALETNEITKKQIDFLKSNAALPEKLAIISALGWGSKAQANHDQLYKSMMEGKDSVAQLSVDQLTVLAYAQGLGNYFDMSLTYKYLQHINFDEEKRESVFWVMNLIVCQALLDDMSQWCTIYERGQGVFTYEGLTRDMKPETVQKGIMEYLNIYKDTCTETEE